MIEISGSLYTCDCGYRTISKDCASKHSKTKKCVINSMTREDMIFYSKQENIKEEQLVIDNGALEDKNAIIKNQEDVIKRQRKSIMMLSETVVECDDEEENVGDGLIYFVEDVDIPDRGKVGRTKNTDLKKLKSRYATFASPRITCFYSTNINKDENDLKKLLRDAGCMASHNEKITNCDVAASIFLEFSRR